MNNKRGGRLPGTPSLFISTSKSKVNTFPEK